MLMAACFNWVKIPGSFVGQEKVNSGVRHAAVT